MADVTCFGIIVADLVARPVVGFPGKGELLAVEEMRLDVGGCAANTASILQRLGVETSLTGRVGSDALGDFVVSALAKRGLDTAGIKRSEHLTTGSSMVLTGADGDRSFISTLGANVSLGPTDLDWQKLRGSKILHIGGALLLPGFDGAEASAVLEKARKLGLTTSVDTAWDYTGEWWKKIDPYLPYTDIFMPSQKEAEMLTGRKDPADMAAEFIRAGAKVVAIKLGDKGCYVRSAETELMVPPFPVECRDATGAGDAYAAGFLAGWLQGLGLLETARLANATGALVTTAVGGGGENIGPERIQALLEGRGYSDRVG